MTDQELQQLVREYAETIKETVIGQKDLAMSEAEQFLTWLTKTHCIVSRETILSQHAWYMQRMKEVSSARQTNRAKAIALEAAFGTELFEERGDK